MIAPGAAIMQLAWVVRDLEEAAPRFSKIYGAGPFVLSRHIRVGNPLHRGQPVKTDFSTAIAQAGAVQIELIQQHDDGPSVYRDTIRAGQEGFHHVGVIVPDVAAEVARYAALGFPVALSGSFAGADFAYVDTSPAIGHMTEILPDHKVLNGFFGAIRRAAESWDGKSVLLDAASLR